MNRCLYIITCKRFHPFERRVEWQTSAQDNKRTGKIDAVCPVYPKYEPAPAPAPDLQIFIFVYSIPQLAKNVPCPQHRLPTFGPASGCCTPRPTGTWSTSCCTCWGRARSRPCARLMLLQVRLHTLFNCQLCVCRLVAVRSLESHWHCRIDHLVIATKKCFVLMAD